MKIVKFYLCCTLTVSVLAMASFVQAEDKPDAAYKMDPKREEMMKKAEELSKPGQAHKVLEPLAGEWDVEAKCWMAPDAPPTVSKSSSKTTWILNGRFLQEEFKGEMMGKPFNGMSLLGYDNIQKKYKSVWIDDINTAIMTSEGTAEDNGKVLTFTSKMDCPMTGDKEVPMKHVIRRINNDKYTFEMFDLRKEANNKMMELTYTRK